MHRFALSALAGAVAIGLGAAIALLPMGNSARANHMMAWGHGPMEGMAMAQPYGDVAPYGPRAMAAWGWGYPAYPAPGQPPFTMGNPMSYGPGALAPWKRVVAYQGDFFHGIVIVDRNDDGRVSPDEAAAVREQLFLDMDANADNLLAPEEYLRMYMGPDHFFGSAGTHRADMEALIARGFTPLDTNGDGTVDKAEFMNAGAALYALSDVDGDGKVSVWEYRGHEH